MQDLICGAKIIRGIDTQTIVKCDQPAEHLFNVDGQLIALCHPHSDIFWEPDYLEGTLSAWIRRLRRVG